MKLLSILEKKPLVIIKLDENIKYTSAVDLMDIYDDVTEVTVCNAIKWITKTKNTDT